MIDDIAANLKEFFNTNRTKDVSFRIKQLKNLKDSIKHYEPEIVQALRDDLRKFIRPKSVLFLKNLIIQLSI